ncbi:DUF2917 domain-containing protein [Trinickia caryophylli]|uniref:DUF2917 domain-containing protein n=1 Tax=Trinickia caryophylli TaxID=28094 RepID=A0A1X7H195_TRICW|nr:DUF2917 domain-containing protein [Trinickia caryophylli]PMS09997.1 DUF2917 domain-containing protein [Trinickia caryophylli]TRX18351.1 DUF2917 domain-containing protein [Trinickia caryophylli]WQE10865.1 DUF2917 domain-containing protein [Trinickia caryophylli]SMF78101.1 Protein of unknown function [Trinickia caryophylli]GLU35508.1 hypothetical protein Busp01_53500 [Trinickia caryophylli]
MREIRTFEMERDEPAAVWRIAEPSLVTVMAGQLWITVERDAEDYWLHAGESLWLPKGARAWIGAGAASARFTVVSAGARTAPPGTPSHALRAPRRLLAGW